MVLFPPCLWISRQHGALRKKVVRDGDRTRPGQSNPMKLAFQLRRARCLPEVQTENVSSVCEANRESVSVNSSLILSLERCPLGSFFHYYSAIMSSFVLESRHPQLQ